MWDRVFRMNMETAWARLDRLPQQVRMMHRDFPEGFAACGVVHGTDNVCMGLLRTSGDPPLWARGARSLFQHHAHAHAAFLLVPIDIELSETGSTAAYSGRAYLCAVSLPADQLGTTYAAWYAPLIDGTVQDFVPLPSPPEAFRVDLLTDGEPDA